MGFDGIPDLTGIVEGGGKKQTDKQAKQVKERIDERNDGTQGDGSIIGFHLGYRTDSGALPHAPRFPSYSRQWR